MGDSNRTWSRLVSPLLVLAAAQTIAQAQMVLRTENFTTDPGWDGHNNRLASPEPVTQNFGYKTTSNAGGPAGEIGGFITPAAEPAYYAKIIALESFDSGLLTASGTLKNDGGSHILLGFFNNQTINEWRTPNAMSLRLYGRDDYFLAFTDYATSKWRAGGSGGDFEHNVSNVHNWSLSYDPNGNNGGGTLTGVVGSRTMVTNLDPGHKSDGATFNRFGILNRMTSIDGAGQFWVDNLDINGVTHDFSTNPGFEGFQNNRTYNTTIHRPYFDFGYSAGTTNAGGAAGEMGGVTYRGDSRSQFNGTRMAYYGDELDETLTLENPLHAHGKVAFHRGVSDSGTLIGFFHDQHSMMDDEQGRMRDFVGASIEGPSAEGHFFYPVFSTDQLGANGSNARGVAGQPETYPPYIYPEGESQDFTIDYDPLANNGNGRVTVSLDGQEISVDMPDGYKEIGGHFNRFGIITTHIDGNGQTVYFDDLTYTIGFTVGGPQEWIADATGSWLVGSNWSGFVPPDGVDTEITFGSAITANRLVYANSDVTVGNINFNDNNSYLIGGLGSLTLQVSTGSAEVNVQQGAHKINLPMIIASNTNISVLGGASLTISDPVTVEQGKTLNVSGTVQYESTVTFESAAAAVFESSQQLDSVSMAPSASIDVTDSALVLDSADYDSMQTLVKQGFNGGDWAGTGITSSTAQDDPNLASAVGIVDNFAAGYSEFAGFTGLSGSEVLLAYTSYGDADLGGTVDLEDFNQFLHGYSGDTDAIWLNGDFDYNGLVDLNDFMRYLRGLEHQPAAKVSPELFAALSEFVGSNGVDVDLSTVPEPQMALLALGSLLFARRGRS